MKNRYFGFLIILIVALVFCSCVTVIPTNFSPAVETSADPDHIPEVTTEQGSRYTGFKYVHDPLDNPEAIKDIIVNPLAVYGFSPDPRSSRLGVYMSYDWTDPVFVESARQERIAYHESLKSMVSILSTMASDGASEEEIARAVSTERNRLRLEAYRNDPKALAEVKASNLKTYGHEEGPTPDELYKKYGSWEVVIQKAFSPNLGMDVICGLYDEYYQLYVMLGYVK